MVLLLLRFSLVPLLVGGATKAQSRFGERVGGRIVGLPLTSLPMLLILTLTHDPRYGSAAALSSLAGIAPQVVLFWVYAKFARRPVALALTAGCAAFVAVATVVAFAPLNALGASLLASAALAVVLRTWPERAGTTEVPDVAPRSCELPAPVEVGAEIGYLARLGGLLGSSKTALRIASAGLFALAVDLAAGLIGPRLAGLATALPVVAIVMIGFTAIERDDRAAAQFAHGVALGSYSVVAALAVVAVALPSLGTAPAFMAAVVAALAAQFLPDVVRRLGSELEGAARSAR